MRRILYITDSLIAGGTESQLVELVTRLDRQRFEPYILCLYGDRAGRSLYFLPHLLASNVPVQVLDLGLEFSAKLRGIVEIAQVVRRICPDMVQAVNYHSNLLLRLARPLISMQVKLIGCVYIEYTAKQLVYERLSSWMCAAIVCNSSFVQRQLQGWVSPCPVELIPNGIDVARFAEAGGAAFRDRFAPGARRVLLFMGRIAGQKSPHLLVEALGRIKRSGRLADDVIIWLVGECEEAAEQTRVDAAIAEWDLCEYVRQFPATARPEVVFAAADVTVLPSLREGLPNVVLESLAAGLPAVVSEAANVDGIIRHHVNGWVFRTGDAEDLARVLSVVLSMTDADMARMCVQCQTAGSRFSVEAMVQRYEALYERLSARS